MVPSQLKDNSFSAYPEEARRLAENHLDLLRRLPLSFVPLLLREAIVFDWKFPAERRELEHQFRYLVNLSPDDFRRAMSAFAALRLSPALEATDWVNTPAAFSEQLTARLWATHQIDSFRSAAVEYVKNSTAAPGTLPVNRLALVVLGLGATKSPDPLFAKLAPHGSYFTNVRQLDGLRLLLETVQKRAAAHPEPFGHWCIDGGSGAAIPGNEVTHISYSALSGVRATLQSRMQKTYEGGVFNPEAFRTMLARTRPEEIGLDAGVLSRFELSLLTEGSGTQVFATTFVQWAAREALRRAQPLTLFARFAPRQREKPMNELLAEARGKAELDPQGSLIDADMGAYYTWLNQQRLPGADQATFLVWLEDGEQALAIAPSCKPGARVSEPVDLTDLIARVA